MALPTAGDVHVSSLLTNVAVSYIQRAKNFAADQVFPIVPVEKQSDRYVVIDKSDWFRDEAAERAPGTESAGGGYDVDTTPNYFCRKYAFHKDVDDEMRTNADAPLTPDKTASRFVTQKLLIKRERMWASSFMDEVWGNNLKGIASSPGAGEFIKWSLSGSKPVKNVEAWKELIESTTGYMPNVLVMAPDILAVLKDNSDILDRIKYTQRGIITPEILASLFDLEKVVVPRGVIETAAKRAASAVSRIVAGKILLCYAASEPSIEEPSAGYIFAWRGLLGSSAYGNRVKKFRMEELESDRVEGEMAFDAKLIAPDLGVYASSVI